MTRLRKKSGPCIPRLVYTRCSLGYNEIELEINRILSILAYKLPQDSGVNIVKDIWILLRHSPLMRKLLSGVTGCITLATSPSGM